ncbi:MAG: DUF2461 domain-containing protein [Maricaulaceae bacterium]|jgi:uncharacterized protein (TIGR02453 family)
MAFSGFKPSFFKFFKELAANNDKAWFEANRSRYESDVKDVLRDFVIAMGPKLTKISPNFVTDPKKSVFRIHRDVRFSKDKSPYKTNAGLQFRHARGKDAHVPGFYLHLEPGQVFYGGGVWKPDAPALGRIRDAIVEKTKAWEKAKADKKVVAAFGDLREGDPLTRAPRGYDPDHPAVEDLKRRSFFVMKENTQKAAGSAAFVDEVATTFAAAKPVLKFLTEAVGEEF